MLAVGSAYDCAHCKGPGGQKDADVHRGKELSVFRAHLVQLAAASAVAQQ